MAVRQKHPLFIRLFKRERQIRKKTHIFSSHVFISHVCIPHVFSSHDLRFFPFLLLKLRDSVLNFLHHSAHLLSLLPKILHLLLRRGSLGSVWNVRNRSGAPESAGRGEPASSPSSAKSESQSHTPTPTESPSESPSESGIGVSGHAVTGAITGRPTCHGSHSCGTCSVTSWHDNLLDCLHAACYSRCPDGSTGVFPSARPPSHAMPAAPPASRHVKSFL